MFPWEKYEFFQTAIEHKQVAASESCYLSSGNLLTGYEQLSYEQMNRNLKTCFISKILIYVK